MRFRPPIALGVRARTAPTAAKRPPRGTGHARSPTRSRAAQASSGDREGEGGARSTGGRPIPVAHSRDRGSGRGSGPVPSAAARLGAGGSRKSRDRLRRSRWTRLWRGPRLTSYASTPAPTPRSRRRPRPTSTDGRKGSACASMRRRCTRRLSPRGRHPSPLRQDVGTWTVEKVRAARPEWSAQLDALEAAAAAAEDALEQAERSVRARPEAAREASGRRQGTPGRRQGTGGYGTCAPAEARVHPHHMGERRRRPWIPSASDSMPRTRTRGGDLPSTALSRQQVHRRP